MDYLLGLIGALIAYLLYTKSKQNNDAALLTNQKEKEDLNKLTEKKAVNDGNLKVEEEKREAIKEDMKKQEETPGNEKDDVDFFNKNT